MPSCPLVDAQRFTDCSATSSSFLPQGGLSVPRSAVQIATTSTLGIAAVAASGCGSAAAAPPAGPTEAEIAARIEEAMTAALKEERAAAVAVETDIEDEPEPLVEAMPSGPTEEAIGARIEAANAGPGTMKGREQALRLVGDYRCR